MDIIIAVEGTTGRFTLNRPDSLNALTHEMAQAMEDALNAWKDDDAITQVMIDAAGDKAFCAGGDIQHLYQQGRAGNFKFGQDFWRDEYRLNQLIAQYPKPYIVFMQGFVMGGGVGISCHGSHRIVDDSSKIALPECSIGLIPDVGSSLMLAQAPGRCGEYMATTGYRMNASDAIYAGFADHYIPQDEWHELKQQIIADGSPDAIKGADLSPPPLLDLEPMINSCFDGETMPAIIEKLSDRGDEWGVKTIKTLGFQSPISVACSLEVIRDTRQNPTIQHALEMEYRFTSRSSRDGDFLEGIRAAIIDKTRDPKWRHDDHNPVKASDIQAMLKPIKG